MGEDVERRWPAYHEEETQYTVNSRFVTPSSCNSVNCLEITSQGMCTYPEGEVRLQLHLTKIAKVGPSPIISPTANGNIIQFKTWNYQMAFYLKLDKNVMKSGPTRSAWTIPKIWCFFTLAFGIVYENMLSIILYVRCHWLSARSWCVFQKKKTAPEHLWSIPLGAPELAAAPWRAAQ